MKTIVINNLNKYQHYKDRNIHWIKWYIRCLHDNNFTQLNNEERWMFIGLIILAVLNDNSLPFSSTELTKKLLHYTPSDFKLTSQRFHRGIRKMEKLSLIRIKCYTVDTESPDIKIREDKIRKEKSKLKEKMSFPK